MSAIPYFDGWLEMQRHEIDAAENIKPGRKKSAEKIDGIAALIIRPDRAIRYEMVQSRCV